MASKKQRLEAADRLEILGPVLKDFVIKLRDSDESSEQAYAMVYVLRHELGRIVSTLGVGVPSKAAQASAQQALRDAYTDTIYGKDGRDHQG